MAARGRLGSPGFYIVKCIPNCCDGFLALGLNGPFNEATICRRILHDHLCLAIYGQHDRRASLATGAADRLPFAA